MKKRKNYSKNSKAIQRVASATPRLLPKGPGDGRAAARNTSASIEPQPKAQARPAGGPRQAAHETPAAPAEAITGEVGSSPAFPIIGIGASAGGLAAFEALFAHMPSDSGAGISFVIVQHLDPDHKSILSELVRRYTRMKVFEVSDGMTVEPNCAYIIPPNKDLALIQGKLRLMEPGARRGLRCHPCVGSRVHGYLR